ncbi:PEGA domain-containing protein [Patescibacteria group bacterium]|nr:PEGA domain-containing protein [Patescibacteria group bacterium]
MLKIPFHRRILPWVFVVAFIFMAPALVFYTAGYRWNSKKGVIERNGTFIIDTNPRGATIEINGKKLSDNTPVTLQNTAPGTYTLKLSKDGYHDWSKVFSIEPERVTFATDIYLWPNSEPELITEGHFNKIYTDPNYKNILLVDNLNVSSTLISIMDFKERSFTDFPTLTENLKIKNIHWDSAADEALIFTENNHTYRANISDHLLSTLPDGCYHFEQGKLIGNTNEYLIKIDTNGALTRSDKSSTVLDSYGSMQIIDIAGSKGPVLIEKADADQGFVLPGGNWQFYDVQKNYIILNDGNRWLRLQLENEPYSFTMAYADAIYPITVKRETFYLLHNNNEILTWMPNKEAELIYRQSEPLVSTSWHQDAMDIMMATEKEISMIQLDDRSGRYKTVLVNFDEIFDAIIYENEILILGTKDQKSGLWTLPLEKPSKSISPLGLLN